MGRVGLGWVGFGLVWKYAMGVACFLLRIPKAQEWLIYLFLCGSQCENGSEALQSPDSALQ